MDYFNNFNNMPRNNFGRPVSNLDWIMVQNINQVEQVTVQPNTKAWVMVQNEPVFALRTADSMGLVNTEYYKFEKFDKNTATSDYVTRQELNSAIESILKEVKQYESSISE